MLWIGLTGGIASGKSTVSRLLKARGYQVVDADELVREVSQSGTPAFKEITQAFGQGSISTDGTLNRKKIAEVVFTDRSKLDALEKILHPRVRELATQKRAELARRGTALAFYDVPLLFEKSMESLFDRVVVVVCSRELQLSRLMARNGLTVSEAEVRIQAQLPLEVKAKRGHDVLRNEGTLAELEASLDQFLKSLHQAQT
jgi:dephospho-CoA kinase